MTKWKVNNLALVKRAIKLPPRKIELEIEDDEGVKTVYVLQRPNLKARDNLMDKMGVWQSIDEPSKLDSKGFYYEAIVICLIDPVMDVEALENEDVAITDALFDVANKLIEQTRLTDDQKKA